MAKKIVEDVLPPRRTIRDIPLPGGKREKKEKITNTPKVAVQTRVQKEPRKEARRSRPKRNYTRLGIWVLALLCVIGLVFVSSFLFAGATVTITPKQQSITVNETFSAEKESSTGGLSYTLISVSKEGSKTVPAGGEEKVETRATGKIIIYNNYSTAPQTLVKNTRFETPDGLIFRIQENITIPGYTKSNTIVLPGFLKVTVVADQPGEKYNVGLADFTIPGFKGDPRYTKFNAKSDPAAKIEGGFSGVVRKITDADKTAAKNEIESALKSELVELAKTQIPSTHILFDEMTLFSFEQLPQTSGSSTTATIKEKGTIHGILFDRIELTNFLAEGSISEESNTSSLNATNLEELNVVFENKNSFNPGAPGTVSAKIDGNLNVLWDVTARNAENRTLEEELAGKKRNEINGILSKFSSIERAEVVVRPFWSTSFPEKPNKIKVKIERP